RIGRVRCRPRARGRDCGGAGSTAMIAPQFHPGEVRAQCEPRGKLSFGLTPRTIALLLAGFVFLIFGLWDVRLSYAMPAWDALVLLAAFLDGWRLPKPENLTATRRWSNAP